MGRPGLHQGGGMELHEFHVAQDGAGLPGHRDPIAVGASRVGGVGIQMAAAASGQHHSSAAQPAQLAMPQHLHAAAAPCFFQQLQGDGPAPPGHIGAAFNALLQQLHQRQAGLILGMQHPPAAMGGFQGGAEGLAVAVEVEPQAQQVGNAARRLLHQAIHRCRLAQPCPCRQGVAAVQSG